MALIYHIVPRTTWFDESDPIWYRGDTLEREGFIHFSTGSQVLATADRYYHGVSGMVLLEVDEAALVSPLRYEEAPGGESYPHLYGPLNRDAVYRVYTFEPSSDGRFAFPAAS